jgi:hypothetical protein
MRYFMHLRPNNHSKQELLHLFIRKLRHWGLKQQQMCLPTTISMEGNKRGRFMCEYVHK